MKTDLKGTKIAMLLMVFFSIAVVAEAQPLLVHGAGNAYRQFHYNEAAGLYEKVLRRDSLNLTALNRLADCYDKLNDSRNEERILRKLDQQKALNPDQKKQYALALTENGDYAKALAIYTNLPDETSQRFAAAFKHIEYFYENSAQLKIYSVSGLNSPQSDFAPVLFGKGLVFSSARTNLHAYDRAFAWDNTPFLSLYYTDTARLQKQLYHTSFTKENIADKYTVGDITDLHTDVTAPTPNDTRTLGNLSNNISAPANSSLKVFGKNINTRYHEGQLAFSPDFKTIYFTRSNYTGGKYGKSADGINKLKIYTAALKSDSVWDQVTEFLYNSNEYSCGSPAISAHNKVMFFVSDMPGGFGGTDLYYCVWENGRWAKPVNMGDEINTAAHEMSAFISTDSILYFSSQGHPGLGGQDMFSVNLNESTLKIENLHYPLNSKKDDFGIVFNADNGSGYFSSNRGGQGSSDDIFYFTQKVTLHLKGVFTDASTGRQVDSVKVYIRSMSGALIDSVNADNKGRYRYDHLLAGQQYKVYLIRPGYAPDSITVSTLNHVKNDTLYTLTALKRRNLKVEGYVYAADTKAPISHVPVELYNYCTGVSEKVLTNAEGYYSLDLKPNCCYVISAVIPNCGDHTVKTDASNIYKDLYRLDLALLCKGDVVKIDNIYYDKGKSDIREDAARELDKLLGLFKEYPGLKLELRSHTDCRSDAGYNMALSGKRASAAVQYLIGKGVPAAQITGKGYGETMLVNSCGCEGKTESLCTEEEHQKNRRTEFKILTISETSAGKHKVKVHAMCHE